MPRITPSQMSARSYRKPRNSKTQSNLEAQGPGLGEDPPFPMPWLLGHAEACGIPARGDTLPDWPAPGLLTWPSPPGHSTGPHCAVFLPDHEALSTLQPWGLWPRLPSRLELLQLFPGADGALGAGRGPSLPLLCCRLPPLLLWGSVLRLLFGESDTEGAKKLPGRPTSPSVPL